METTASVLSFLVLLIVFWFTFTIANIIVTTINCRRKEKDLKFCFNAKGRILYSVLSVLYVIVLFGGGAWTIYAVTQNDVLLYRILLNVIAVYSIIYSYFLSSIVLIGNKSLMVGRLLIDYRKLKKVDFTYHNKMSFVFAQKSYSFNVRWIDRTTLRKAISRKG